MIEASSNFIRGAVRSQARAASYAEEAARAQVNTVYLDVLDQVRLIREQIENKQRQMNVLAQRRETTVRTKELYQEQYKLGTRTVVDLLNAGSFTAQHRKLNQRAMTSIRRLCNTFR